MFRIVQAGNALPLSYPVDPSAEFQPGMVAQLGVMGNQLVAGVSDGTAPFGIIDEIKTRAFTAPSVDESVILFVPPVVRTTISGRVYTTIDLQSNLKNSNVLLSTVVSNPVDIEIIPVNGVVIFPEGTELNFDMDGDGVLDSIHTTVSYTYQVPNIPGDDSTAGTGKMTIWFTRMIVQTDMYETNQRYPVNANLFVSESGLFTTRQPTSTHPCIAMVTGPPSSVFGNLELLWL